MHGFDYKGLTKCVGNRYNGTKVDLPLILKRVIRLNMTY